MSLGGRKTRIVLLATLLVTLGVAFWIGQRASARYHVRAAQEATIVANLDRLEKGQGSGANILEGKPDEMRRHTEHSVTQWLQRYESAADQAKGLVWRGRLHLLTTNQEEAVADFNQALELDADSFDARLHLAMTLYEREPKRAVQHLEILWQRDRGNEKISYVLASCCRSLGRLKEAEQILDEFLKDNPRHAGALLERGKTALDGGRPEEAEPFLRRAVAEAPDDAAVRLTFSRCLHLTGKGMRPSSSRSATTSSPPPAFSAGK